MSYAEQKDTTEEEVTQHGMCIRQWRALRSAANASWRCCSGVRVVIEPKALMHVVGTTMDFVEDDLRAEFVFHNPNAKGTCGCGESFNA